MFNEANHPFLKQREWLGEGECKSSRKLRRCFRHPAGGTTVIFFKARSYNLTIPAKTAHFPINIMNNKSTKNWNHNEIPQTKGKSENAGMNLLAGVPLLYQQFKALFKKNLLLSWRSKRATFLQLFSSLFFIFLIFIIQEARKAQTNSTTAYKILRDPKPLVAPPIPPCEDKLYINLPCFDFIWSGNDSQRIGSIVSAMMKNNPGRPIPDSKVISVWFRWCFMSYSSRKWNEKLEFQLFLYLFFYLFS